MRKWNFAKGHATLNDFIMLKDRHAMLPLTEAHVQLLCHRRAGVGADGLLRAVKAQHIPEWDGDPELWFMDYRNADGSIAEMCGNGLRLFVRYLLDEGLVRGTELRIGTRAGLRHAWALSDGRIRTGMGPVVVEADTVQIDAAGGSWRASAVNVGNPHAVVELASPAEVDALDLGQQPTWMPHEVFPHGVNIEFISPVGERHLHMRVHERGVGETMSCGTGVVAAAAAYARSRGLGLGLYQVDVPGGTLEVELTNDEAFLTGGAVIIGTGDVLLPD